MAAPPGGVAAQRIAPSPSARPALTGGVFFFCHAHRYLYLRGLRIAPYCHSCTLCYTSNCPARCNSPRRRGARRRPARKRLRKRLWQPASCLESVARMREPLPRAGAQFQRKDGTEKRAPYGALFSIAAPPPVRTTVPPGSHLSNVPVPPGRSHTTPSPPQFAPAPATTTPQCPRSPAVRCRPRAHTR